ncbi:MAG: HNH endonuclease signature motif containing protein [Candidatus Pacebacteria bacterium]|nr:HNH endonuclease signature motif containing protein [Candidatus Paceibacterota bacterium]
MAAIQPQQLIQSIKDAVQESGYSSILVSSERSHPRKFVVTSPDESEILTWIYIWTLTPGGRPHLENEYRIQMTTVRSPLEINPSGPTVLMGYEPSLNMFAGFDLGRHQVFTTGSPSVQIDIRTIRKAIQDGLSFDRKDNGEIAIGIRPDQFISYILNAASLHKAGFSIPTFNLLEKAASLQTISVRDINSLPAERKHTVQMIDRISRAANFRQQVLRAYGFRCSVTQMQLRLIDAAHILPVQAPGSIDDVRNGIALSPTYHRAYDNGLIYLDQSYIMRVNPAKEKELIALHLDGGINAFKDSLNKIILPPDKNQWPNVSLIQKANSFRGIPVK